MNPFPDNGTVRSIPVPTRNFLKEFNSCNKKLLQSKEKGWLGTKLDQDPYQYKKDGSETMPAWPERLDLDPTFYFDLCPSPEPNFTLF